MTTIKYQNLSMVNDTDREKQTEFNNYYNSNFLDKQNDWNLVIKRLDIDTSRIPICNINNINNLNLRFINNNDSTEYKRNVKDFFPPNTKYIYHMDEILTAFNNCLTDIYEEAVLTTNTLTYRYDYSSHKWIAKITKPTQPTFKHSLFMDDVTYQWFGEAFLHKYNSDTNEYEMLYMNEWNSTVVSHIDSEEKTVLDYMTVHQEFSTLSNIFECNKVVLLSNNLSTNPESLSTAFYNPTNLANTVTPTNNSILFDITYLPSSGRKQLVYSDPNNDTRIVQLIGQSPLSNMNIQVLYQTKKGEMFPIMIPPTSSSSIKIKYIRKE